VSCANSCASSPCIGVCKLDENKVCIGCFRTIDEIRKKGLERIAKINKKKSSKSIDNE